MFSTISCASQTTLEEYEFHRYQQEFVDYSKGKYTLKQVKSIPIFLKEYKYWNNISKEYVLDKYTIGTCYPWGPFAYITINQRWWYTTYSHLKRQQLIFHEVAHCLSMKKHVRPTSSPGIGGKIERFLFRWGFYKVIDDLSDNCPSSYMHPEVVGEMCMRRHYDYYIDELFDRMDRDGYETIRNSRDD